MRLRSLLVLMLLGGVVGGLEPRSVQSGAPGVTDKIVFSGGGQFTGREHDIFVMNPDGSGREQLTSGSDTDLTPSWSPDGSKIAFSSDRDNFTVNGGIREIYVMNADGTGLTELTQSDAFNLSPSWSPSGAQIAFQRADEDRNSDIFVMNADGSGEANLTNGAGFDSDPTWSPDGTKIAFARFQDGHRDIYTMNADGTDAVNLVPGPFEDSSPAWSPDGAWIAFHSNRDATDNEFVRDIYVMNADGSDHKRLTSYPGDDVGPAWSPDGTLIAFASERDESSEDWYNYEIYVMNPDGTGQERLTFDRDLDTGPDWVAVKDPHADTDGDTIPNAGDLDDDNDGCTDAQETEPDPMRGGFRDPHNFWDVYSVWSGEPATRDASVSISDVGAVVSRFGASRNPPPSEPEAFVEALSAPPPAPAYHASFDRGGPAPGGNLWNLLSPDGIINIVDIGSVVAQFGHTCA